MRATVLVRPKAGMLDPQGEVRALLFGPDGSLFAGTASAAGGGPSVPINTGVESVQAVVEAHLSWSALGWVRV